MFTIHQPEWFCNRNDSAILAMNSILIKTPQLKHHERCITIGSRNNRNNSQTTKSYLLQRPTLYAGSRDQPRWFKAILSEPGEKKIAVSISGDCVYIVWSAIESPIYGASFSNWRNQTSIGHDAKLTYPQTVKYLKGLVEIGLQIVTDFRPKWPRKGRCHQLFNELEDDLRPVVHE